ncbi:protein BEX4 isoform X1 [Balaenoptera musculus]|uniref:Brain expressed X-linked 4 n=2 Tax=Balaenoptera musculus TaxID=9771 RepID=A0A8B8WFX0_BALMU|nr:protein BEX4 isoform X1 [Balaenoptera musculus]
MPPAAWRLATENGLRVEVSRRRTCSKNREKQETARIGPGAMASKEEQAVKNLNMENTQQENEGGDQAPLQHGEESRDLGGGRGQKPGGNVRLGRVRRLVPNFRWAIPSRHIDHSEVGDDVEKHAGQMMEIRRKTKKQQMRHHVRYQTPEPDNHYEFCLIP